MTELQVPSSISQHGGRQDVESSYGTEVVYGIVREACVLDLKGNLRRRMVTDVRSISWSGMRMATPGL